MEKWSLEQYFYELPRELIAQEPTNPRDKCRLLVLNRTQETIKELYFFDIVDFLQKGDVLVLNNTKVIKARLYGQREKGAKVEILLLKKVNLGEWEVLVKPAKRARIKDTLIFKDGKLRAQVIAKTEKGSKIVQFFPADIENLLVQVGETPFPPYIKKTTASFEDYQTIYAKNEGAVAAPTAGLHFTEELLEKLLKRGINIVYLTLHCGLATFRPVKVPDIRKHDIDSEYVELSSQAAEIINKARSDKKRIIAVGTTAVRSLESAAFKDSKQKFMVKPFCGQTNLYITAGYDFKITDGLITNFHTPYSTNLILVSAFAGLEFIRRSYNYAIDRRLRFYSFGDAMFIY
ncbi:MAG: tRNA preQ1(34) S-adenosylmethionine ribosyltransferase-isomerase QueA [Candidatus Omnitrophica bacterium]|jgi:S-adenosylmethionine:tRNA ribosyltransferase-isomerase|nr:tRNA preQ1(34) S-adenosylmethionine ribosyltransferase-isomerase QueA [Candidatus Omnitrophota bacterium]